MRDNQKAKATDETLQILLLNSMPDVCFWLIANAVIPSVIYA
jgi:hypothetical protein